MKNIKNMTQSECYLLNYLYFNNSVSAYELIKLGIKYPTQVVYELKMRGFKITRFYQQTHEKNGQIIYGHYRYKLLPAQAITKVKKRPLFGRGVNHENN